MNKAIRTSFFTIILGCVVFASLMLGSRAFADNTVTATPTDEIADSYPGQEETTFIQSFWAQGGTDEDITFVGIWWPTADASDTHAVAGIGSRKAGTPANTKTEITLDILYSATTPGTSYTYDIRDVAYGKVYYTGTFTSPGTTPPPPGPPTGPGNPPTGGVTTNGITVTKALSTDGLTVTFTITGAPESGHDADFIFSYMSTSNALFQGEDQNFGTRVVGATGTQTLSFTLPTNQGFVVDSQNFVVDQATVTYDLTDGDLNLYAFGNFGPGPSPGTPGGPAGTPGGPVVPPTKPSAVVADPSPDQSGGLVPCDGRASKSRCGWAQIVQLINKVMTWLLYMTVPIAAAMFAYAGFLFLTKGASEEARSKAKGIFASVFVGLIFILAAVLIIKTILAALGVEGAYSSFL